MRKFGEMHPHTLIAKQNLALTYASQGQLEKAVVEQEAVLAVSKVVFGEQHPYTLTAIQHLTSTYFMQNRIVEAVVLRETVLQARKQRDENEIDGGDYWNNKGQS